jgi:hypothetical protein
VGMIVSIVLVGAAPPAGALTQDDTNVHGCDIRASAQSVIGLDWRRWTVAQLGGADTPACGALRVEHLTVFTNDNGLTRTATSNVDLLELILPGDHFDYQAAQIGTFRFARAEFSWCASGGTSCATRTRTRITIWKGGNVLFG